MVMSLLFLRNCKIVSVCEEEWVRRNIVEDKIREEFRLSGIVKAVIKILDLI